MWGAPGRRPASEKVGPSLRQSQMFTVMSEALPCSWGGRKAVFTNCPNIWTGKKANRNHADVFKAQCWVSAEIRQLGEEETVLMLKSIMQTGIGSKTE